MLSRAVGRYGVVSDTDKARIRVQLSASHSLDEVHEAVEAFVAVGRKLRVIR